MDEYFLQFLWKFQKFQQKPLLLSNGDELVVFHPGHQNHHSGPDFLEANIKINALTWSGSIEVHIKSSYWLKHGHNTDKAYQNVVLHVVWLHDQEILSDGQPIPTLQLKDYISNNLEQEYKNYINQPKAILCADYLKHHTQNIHIGSMIDRSVASRLQEKGKGVLSILRSTDGDWEETSYRVIARNFGFKVNAEPFEQLASTLPYKIIRKHTGEETSTYALIFGMAGFLAEPKDDYQHSLADEFRYLCKKYRITPSMMRHHWKFAKMRPANFPSVRLAEFSALLSNTPLLFTQIINISNLESACNLIQQELPEYWETHYDFEKSSKKPVRIGKSSLTNILINSVVPILVAYSKYLDDVTFLNKAYSLLESLPAEKNHIIKKWEENTISPINAAESQALLFQYHTYCIQKKCLQCNIGLTILNPKK